MRTILHTAFSAEDGTKFFDQNDALTYEALLYIRATLDAYGPEEVMLAVNQVQTADPAFTAGLQGVATILQRRQAIIPDAVAVKAVKSINAPANVRSPDATEVVPINYDPAQDPYQQQSKITDQGTDSLSGGSSLLRRLGTGDVRSGDPQPAPRAIDHQPAAADTVVQSTGSDTIQPGNDTVALSSGISGSDTLSGSTASDDLLSPRPATSDAAVKDVADLDNASKVAALASVPAAALASGAPVVQIPSDQVTISGAAPDVVLPVGEVTISAGSADTIAAIAVGEDTAAPKDMHGIAASLGLNTGDDTIAKG
jgi:hypothetical protein